MLIGRLAEAAGDILLLLFQLSPGLGVPLPNGIEAVGLLALVVAHADAGDVRIDCVLARLEHHLHRLAVGLGAVAPDLRQLALLLGALLDGAVGIGRVQVLDAELHLGGSDLAGGLGLAQPLHTFSQILEALSFGQRPVDDGIERLDLVVERLGAVLAGLGGILVGLLLRSIAPAADRIAWRSVSVRSAFSAM